MDVGRGRKKGDPALDFNEFLTTPLAETPLSSGRAVSFFARDSEKLRMTGKVLMTSQLMQYYNILDERGVRSPPFLSLKYSISIALKPLLQKIGIWEVHNLKYKGQKISLAANIYWNYLPSVSIPAWIVKIFGQTPIVNSL